MKTCVEYLDKIKKLKQFTSDYQLAKFLGETPARIGNYRNRGTGFDDEMSVKVADILGLDHREVIAVANYQRAKRPEQKEFWKDFAKRISSAAAAIMVAVILIGSTIEPAHAINKAQYYILC